LKKLSANAQFFIGAQIPVSLYEIIPGVSLRTTLGAYASCAQLKPKLSESRWNSFTQGGCAMFMCVFGHCAASTVLLVARPFRGR